MCAPTAQLSRGPQSIVVIVNLLLSLAGQPMTIVSRRQHMQLRRFRHRYPFLWCTSLKVTVARPVVPMRVLILCFCANHARFTSPSFTTALRTALHTYIGSIVAAIMKAVHSLYDRQSEIMLSSNSSTEIILQLCFGIVSACGILVPLACLRYHDSPSIFLLRRRCQPTSAQVRCFQLSFVRCAQSSADTSAGLKPPCRIKAIPRHMAIDLE